MPEIIDIVRARAERRGRRVLVVGAAGNLGRRVVSSALAGIRLVPLWRQGDAARCCFWAGVLSPNDPQGKAQPMGKAKGGRSA